jgi:hypothetical protein
VSADDHYFGDQPDFDDQSKLSKSFRNDRMIGMITSFLQTSKKEEERGSTSFAPGKLVRKWRSVTISRSASGVTLEA